MATKEYIKQTILSKLKGFLKPEGFTLRDNKGQRAILDAVDGLTPKNEKKNMQWDSGSIFTLFSARETQTRNYSSKALDRLATAASEDPILAGKINDIIQSKATDRNLEDVRNSYQKINKKNSAEQAKTKLSDRVAQTGASYAGTHRGGEAVSAKQSDVGQAVNQGQSTKSAKTPPAVNLVAFEKDKKKEEEKRNEEFDSITTRDRSQATGARSRTESEAPPPPPPDSDEDDIPPPPPSFGKP